MTDRDPHSPPADSVPRDPRAVLVDRLYEVALDPVRLEDLMDVWESCAAPLRAAAGTAVPDDPELEAHLRRATVFLARTDAALDRGGPQAALEEISRSAAFLSDGDRQIAACNRSARVAFGLEEGCPFDRLPFEPEDCAALQREIRKVARGRVDKAVTLRMRSTRTGSPVILRLSQAAAAAPLALVVSTELVWPEGFETTVQQAFGLTAAEVEILRSLTQGLPIRDIAEARGRSQETVRTQLRSIQAKTGTHSQSELVRVVLGLMQVEGIAAAPPSVRRGRDMGAPEPRPLRELHTTGGRRLTWIEFGDPAGQPVLYMHLDYGLIRWPARAERAAQARGLRVIVPVRAGYGGTDPHPGGVDHIAGVTADYAAVLDHLGVTGAVALPLGADLRFAMNLANTRPDLVRGILGCACQLPLRSAAQYERMDRWQRFILANARYAPTLLPFVVQAAFSMARRLGKDRFFALVNGGSPADMETFARAEVRMALLAGSDTCLSAMRSAHEAFTRECISSEGDWSGIVRACTVPVLLLQGDQDPQSPVQTVHDLTVEFPHLEVRFLPRTGQLLFFAEWPRVLEALCDMVGNSSPDA